MTDTLRSVALSDSAALTALHAAAFGREAWSRADLEGSLALSTTHGWMTEEEGRPVAFILCQSAADEAEILTLAVHPDARRRGQGRALVRHACRSIPGAARLFLEVASDNLAAIRLYESCGFTRIGARRGYYHRPDGAVDALTYERKKRLDL